MINQKVESQESKYDKAQISTVQLLEQVMSNLDNELEKRLSQDKIQQIKKYYLEEYRYFFEYKYLVFAFIASIIVFSIAEKNKLFLGSDPFEIFAVFIISVTFLRFNYDRSQSKRVYIKKLLGSFDSEKHSEDEILDYMEEKIFFQNSTILEKNYYIITAIGLIPLIVGFITDERIYLASLVVLSFVTLFEMPFVKIKVFVKSKKARK